MEKRSRQRVRDQVALMAFGAESRMRSSARGYPSWPGTETFRSRAGYRSARPITSRSSLSACNARPVHTEGPIRKSIPFGIRRGTAAGRIKHAVYSVLQPYQFLAEIFSSIKLGNGRRAMFDPVGNLFEVTELPVADPFGQTFDCLHVPVLIIEDKKA